MEVTQGLVVSSGATFDRQGNSNSKKQQSTNTKSSLAYGITNNNDIYCAASPADDATSRAQGSADYSP